LSLSAVSSGILLYARGSPLQGIIFIIFSLIFFSTTIVNMLLLKSDIVIDESGISMVLFSINWKFIMWSQVSKIRLMDMTDYSRGLVTWFFIERLGGSRVYFFRSGSIIFNEKINNIDDLLNTINVYSHKYDITIIVRSGSTIRQITDIRPSDCAMLKKTR
jgi:hypothetical protein